jgi:hypothetical protein
MEVNNIKIHKRKITKKYNEKVYTYEQYALVLPLKSNKELSSFVGRQLALDIKDDAIVLTVKEPDPIGEIVS